MPFLVRAEGTYSAIITDPAYGQWATILTTAPQNEANLFSTAGSASRLTLVLELCGASFHCFFVPQAFAQVPGKAGELTGQ